MAIRFYFNGLKVDGGPLVRGHFSLIKAWSAHGRDVPTHLVMYCKAYEPVPEEVRQAFKVENRTDLMTDYFDTDTVRIPPEHPLFREAARALQQDLERAIKRCEKNGKDRDAAGYRSSLADLVAVLRNAPSGQAPESAVAQSPAAVLPFTRACVAHWMRRNASAYVDPTTGKVNATALAENAAEAFEQKTSGGPLDDEMHWIWDLAAGIAIETETSAPTRAATTPHEGGTSAA
jgi:hypothetical protein